MDSTYCGPVELWFWTQEVRNAGYCVRHRTQRLALANRCWCVCYPGAVCCNSIVAAQQRQAWLSKPSLFSKNAPSFSPTYFLAPNRLILTGLDKISCSIENDFSYHLPGLSQVSFPLFVCLFVCWYKNPNSKTPGITSTRAV